MSFKKLNNFLAVNYHDLHTVLSGRCEFQDILSKNKECPGNSFHASVNRGENILLLNACLATFDNGLCRMAVHFGF